METSISRPPTWLRWLAVAVTAGGIFVASVLDPPSSGLSSLGPLGLVGMDKWLHALAYAGLAGALAVALAPGRSPAVVALLAAGSAVAYGVGIEFVQASIPARGFSVGDILANVVGAGLGLVVWRAAMAFVGRSDSGDPSESEV